jgi:membrane protein implicated in regulation of membrane protease activity
VAPGHASSAGHGGAQVPSEISIAANQQFNTGQATALSRFHMPAQGDHSIAVRVVEMLNPMMIATFLTYFGLTGLIAHFGVPALSYYSLVPAFIAGYASTHILLYVMNWMSARMEISSAAIAENFVGLQAQVILPISNGRVGEITYETGSKRYNSPARANVPPRDFDRGEKVLIVDIRDNVMYVEPWAEIYPSSS